MPLRLISSAFEPMGRIPRRYTCEGEDISPPLSWTDPPEGTKSFALLVDDPDAPDPEAPKLTWTHWILYHLPPECRGLEEGVAPEHLPAGTGQGRNDWKRTGWGGPCPPIGRHRYFYRLYALARAVELANPPARSDLLKAMEGHILAGAELVGTYQKGD
jgi:Raf kinase inhibitor-like YbhB/YbcL family protein